ncbi:MAG TPA: anaerobic ribonucleoside-triphosphate reductase activating protein [Burkholderiales bacterium]|nr:anaerobic ribonucleoside-triphosphate reductase activating protein [Burkholderiales bacterium]
MLRVGGLTPFSTIDYPGKLAAVVFCQGCAWRCTYCHNPHLLPFHKDNLLPWKEVLSFLRTRRGMLDAVVFSGGEPTLQHALKAAIEAVKAMGYAIGLHTAGIAPRRLAQVLPLLDWVAMDLKASFDEHERITRTPGSARRARESLELIAASGIPCRFHTVYGDARC